MAKDSAQLIDVCIEYIESKDMHYLAKEGKLVYYTSPTGRKSDYLWIQQSFTETVRIIRATKLAMDDPIKDEHLLAAFQELDRVYEYAVKTRHQVAKGVFNYMEHTGTNLGENIMALLSQRLHNMGIRSFVLVEVLGLFQQIASKLDAGVSASEARSLLYKYFEGMGYDIRTGSNRPLVDGKRTPVIMAPDTKPAEVGSISLHEYAICKEIIRELK